MLRRVHRERALALSGPRALLMQAAHPLAVSGLLAHTTALDEPYERLARTARVLSTIGFGSKRDADRVTAHVRAMHRQVRGTLKQPVGPYPAGTPYRADDPELLMWVLFTLVDSALVVYGKYVRSIDRDEQAALWDDYRVIGRLFGLRDRDMPAGIDELDEYRRAHARRRPPPRKRLGPRARARDRARARPSRGQRDRCVETANFMTDRAAPGPDPAPVRLRAAAAGGRAQGAGRRRRRVRQARGDASAAGPATAERSASANGVGLTSNSSVPDESVTTVGERRLSISGRAIPASTGVTSPIHSEDSHGVSSGTDTRGRRRLPSAAAISSSMPA